MTSTLSDRLQVAWSRFSAKTSRQRWRFIFTRIWPLSILGRGYYARVFGQRWYRLANRRSRALFKASHTSLNSTESLLYQKLTTTGIFIDREAKLFGEQQVCALVNAVERYWKAPAIATQLADRHSVDGAKWYVIRAFGRKPPPLPLEIQQILFDESLLNIISCYLGAWPKLRYVDLWHNLAADDAERSIDSEHWHRDAEDLHVVTLFLYLTDVGIDQGAFSYIKESQHGAKYGGFAPARPPLGSSPPTEDIRSHLPTDHITRCDGPQGSVVLCDTSGLHRGGRVRCGSRVLLTARYFSSVGLDRIGYTTESNSPSQLSERVQFLLS